MSADSSWPPSDSYSVTGIPGTPAFQQVSGLADEAETIEYRKGSGIFGPTKMPGLRKGSSVTMTKGIFIADQHLWTWFNAIATNSIAPSTVEVRLFDETGNPSVAWTLNAALPTRIAGIKTTSNSNQVTVESLELAYETLTVSFGR